MCWHALAMPYIAPHKLKQVYMKINTFIGVAIIQYVNNKSSPTKPCLNQANFMITQ